MTRVASVAALIAAACAAAVVAVLLAADPAGADAGPAVTTVRATLGQSGSRTVVGVAARRARTGAGPYVQPTPRATTVSVPSLLTAGVSVGGTLVGGLTKGEARGLIEQRFERALPLVLGNGTRIALRPEAVGAVANVDKALRTAGTVRQQGFLVPLDVRLSERRLDALLDSLARRVDRKPKDARLVLRGLTPVILDATPGVRLDREAASRAIALALRTHSRDDVVLPLTEKPAKVDRDAFRTSIVIQRGGNRLHFYVDGKLKRTFRVATGAPSFPTPLGRFTVINMQRDPWWYPPASSWAEGLEPVPPGPSNPLGTRWMGISSPAVGIHGTPNAASIGYSASHGCIRMLIPQVEWLFERVKLGTTVFIVSA